MKLSTTKCVAVIFERSDLTVAQSTEKQIQYFTLWIGQFLYYHPHFTKQQVIRTVLELWKNNWCTDNQVTISGCPYRFLVVRTWNI